ncbi:CotH kinase family protein [Populibacterium corticicola]|uniref:CotH kinase family protein n=1 Tax=Populibacterium corticicola TaxID=1812826 RepID=A0ABW5XBM7_9MICO
MRDDSSLDNTVFDASEIHTFSITYDEAEYAAMIETYSNNADKKWISATAVIDGTTFENVGLRLKGNSSLRGVSAETSGEDIPWLIRLDKYVDGQNLDGYTDFVVRSNSSETSLNEAISQTLFAEAGLASQAAIAVRFSANGSAEVLRLVVENPNDEWDESQFDSPGILYKAEADGDYSYRGDDPASYEDVFDQESDKDNENYTPLIEFLQFINESEDETFAAELPEHLDVTAFASYLAMQDLVDNFDDISGPGNNSYLRWNSETGVFTVVNWDLNLAFGANAVPGATEQGDRDGEIPGSEVSGPGNPPEGFEPGDTPDRSGGGNPPEGFEPGDTPDRSGGGKNIGLGNILKERFLEVAEFNELYQQAAADLRAELYDSGRAQEVLDQWTALLSDHAADLVDADTLAQESQSIAAYFTATNTTEPSGGESDQ